MHLCFHKIWICFQFWILCFINKSLKPRCINGNRNFLLEIISPHYDTALIIQFTASVLNGSNEKWGHINLYNSTCCSRLVFCFKNWSDLLWQKIVLVIEINFRNSMLKAENLQNFWNYLNNLCKQWKVRTFFGNRMFFLTSSWRCLKSNTLERLQFKLEKIVGI